MTNIYLQGSVHLCKYILRKWPHLESFKSGEYEFPDAISTFWLLQVPKQVWLESVLPILYISNPGQRKGKGMISYYLDFVIIFLSASFVTIDHNHQNLHLSSKPYLSQTMRPVRLIFLGEHEATEQTRYCGVQGRR